MTVYFRAESQMLTDYIHYLFPPQEKDGPCVVNGCHMLGRLLAAHCRASPLRPEVPAGENVMQLKIPSNDTTRHLIGHFLYIPQNEMPCLNMAIKAVFELDLKLYYAHASSLGFSKRDIIEAFITSRGLINADPSEALHKRIYRRECARRENLTRILIRKLKYIDESLDLSGLPKKIDL